MAGRHIKELIAAYHDRDDLAFRRATQGIIDEEEAKQHTTLARDLRRLLAAGTRSVQLDASVLPDTPRDRDTNVPLVDVSMSDLGGLQDVVLAEPARATLQGVVDEVRRWDALDAAGIRRRTRLLLYGPPGCGKTSIASAMAAALRWPLASTRFDSLVYSYLGETASNLRSLFDFAAASPCVLLLDEFDSLGKLRDDPSDHGELRRVVNAVLQLIDKHTGPSIVIAATNHPKILDTAMWRRFDEVVEVPLPTDEQIALLLRRQLPRTFEYDIDSLVHRLSGLPFAAVAHTANSARRLAALDDRRNITAQDLDTAVATTVARRWL